ncbi:M48 family metallopeptidase [Simiduia agarivorans]|uniref:Peptidase M48 Ste24p n=1 Tax=Simiduia agarivorans (strain DSM 21679 / JCM 13881 / BCRC 17597 / SA1) TaxID=1117647 RepID=K4KJ41_SIMAS|nr:M48 family metallopeptidase [Simiduia agarivorans]AFU99061.1 peptidase M48 Ste24p [Simiduia agarivorans SA1 = DSM 21679]
MSLLTIEGSWQDGASSAACPARLVVTEQQVELTPAGQPGFTAALEDISISPKLGRTPRYLTFSCHPGRLECQDHASLDALDQRIGSKGMQLIHRLENHLGMVALAAVTVLFMGFSYFYWGIPAASDLVSRYLPDNVLQQASDDTLLVMKKRYFETTTLPEETQNRLREKVATYAPDYPLDKLHFFAAPDMGANAFALPDGTIVFTDEIIALTDGNDDEMLAVFGHELGHVRERHALRHMLQSSGIALTIALIGGDVSSLGDIVLTLPVVFTQLSFSRKFELEADAYSAEFMRKHQLDPEAFARILTKLHESHGVCTDDTKKDADDCDSTPKWMEYLSTHPHLEERIKSLSHQH